MPWKRECRPTESFISFNDASATKYRMQICVIHSCAWRRMSVSRVLNKRHTVQFSTLTLAIMVWKDKGCVHVGVVPSRKHGNLHNLSAVVSTGIFVTYMRRAYVVSPWVGRSPSQILLTANSSVRDWPKHGATLRRTLPTTKVTMLNFQERAFSVLTHERQDTSTIFGTQWHMMATWLNPLAHNFAQRTWSTHQKLACSTASFLDQWCSVANSEPDMMRWRT